MGADASRAAEAREAYRRYVEERGGSLEMRDLFKAPLSVEELRALLGGRPAATIFAARSPTVKKLGLDPSTLDEERMLALMAEHPTLIRRPLLVRNGELIVGFDRPAYGREFGT